MNAKGTCIMKFHFPLVLSIHFLAPYKPIHGYGGIPDMLSLCNYCI